MSAGENVAPLKQIRLKQRTDPWMDPEVLVCIKDRDKAYHKYKIDKTEENLTAFRNLRNKTQSAISSAKKNYFKYVLEENKNNSKSVWQTLKKLGLPSKKSQPASNIGLKIGDNLCFEKLNVAEKFNSFYTTVASKLVEKLPFSSNIFGESSVFNFYSSMGVKSNFYNFCIVSEDKVFKYINKLGFNKAIGLDGIPPRFVKDSAEMT